MVLLVAFNPPPLNVVTTNDTILLLLIFSIELISGLVEMRDPDDGVLSPDPNTELTSLFQKEIAVLYYAPHPYPSLTCYRKRTHVHIASNLKFNWLTPSPTRQSQLKTI